MPTSYRNRQTPGVYVSELPASGSAIVGVATDVPVFIGYTAFAREPGSGAALGNTAVPVASMADFSAFFGGAAEAASPFNLYWAMRLFFANGGGRCLVVSVGFYGPGTAIRSDELLAGLKVAGLVTGPTMIVVPEACQLPDAEYGAVVGAMLTQAGTLQDRMAILDLPGCLAADSVAALTAAQGTLAAQIAPYTDYLSYGVAYAPALRSTVGADGGSGPVEIVLPPSAALAGVWCKSDAENGVWNAPANIALGGVAAPLCLVNDSEQEGFNMPIDGQAICIIRDMANRGSVVWGAQTLDGNSQDYRYIQVRRTLIYVEQSIKLALNAYVFAANDATTWATVTAAISNFLTGLWQQGGLMGSKPSEAFTVQCGVGTSMTAQNVLDGIMVVAVTLQMIHPAEFIELTFKQTMGS